MATAMTAVAGGRYGQPALSQQALITEHLPLVQRLVRWIARSLPAGVDRDDLQSAGLVGLVSAARRYQPRDGLSFASYARFRVRGAIYDELRGVDHLPRRRRAMVKKLQAARASVSAATGVAPGAEQEAAALKLDWRAHERVRLDESLAPSDADVERLPVEPRSADSDGDAFNRLHGAELHAALRVALVGLPERLRAVLRLYYQEERTLLEIGRALDVTESRVCQLHGEALAKLRRQLAAYT